MPARTIPLPTSAPVLVYGEGASHPPVTIVNASGGGTVIRIDSAQPSDTSGQPLSDGGTLPWDEDLPLWLAGPGQVILSDNSGQPFDPGAIASSLILQGLPTAIASAIAITGAPPIDKLALLASNQVGAALNTTFVYANGTSATWDTSGYNSLILQGRVIGPVLRATGTGLGNWVKIVFQWFDTAGNLLDTDQFVVYDSNTRNPEPTFIHVPVKGPRGRIYFTPGNTAAGQTVTFVVEASYRSIPRTKFYTMPGWYNGTDLAAQYGASWGGTIESNGLDLYTSISALSLTVSGGAVPNMIIPIPVRSGRAILQLRTGVVTPQIDFGFRDTMRSELLAGAFVGGSGALTYTVDTLLPNRQIEIFFRNRDAATAIPSATINVTYDVPN